MFRSMRMRTTIAAMLIINMTSKAFCANNLLSIKVLKIERSVNVIYLILSVDNNADQRFEYTRWSCVFFNNGEPVHEERSSVENIPPRGRAIKREIQGYGGPVDNVECRFMSSRPSTCP